jgi:hypothetical protein
LEALEQAVVTITGRAAQATEAGISSSTIDVATNQRSKLKQREGILLKEGASTRYINETLFSRVLDEVRSIALLFFQTVLNLEI